MPAVSFPQINTYRSQFPQIDFSSLANLPNAFWQGQQVSRQNQARQGVSDALKRGDYQGAVAALAQANPGAAVNAYTQTQIPSWAFNPEVGFYNPKNPTQTIQPPGGTGKPLPQPTIDRASDLAGIRDQLGGLAATFKPEYAGYSVPQKLDYAEKGGLTGALLENAGVISPKDVEAADWWKGYGGWAEVVRNKLYGSVLTPSDIYQFEKNRIGPSTKPEVIPEFLKNQQDIVNRAIERKSGALKASRYNPSAVNEAFGINQEPPTSNQQQYQDGQTATNPQTGERLLYQNGAWVPLR